jgi:hypothetical protein
MGIKQQRKYFEDLRTWEDNIKTSQIVCRLHWHPAAFTVAPCSTPQKLIHSYFLRSIIILSSHQRLGVPSGSSNTAFPTKIYAFLSVPYVLHVLPIFRSLTFLCMLSGAAYVREPNLNAPLHSLFELDGFTSVTYQTNSPVASSLTLVPP